jgi:serine protease Do
MRFVVASVALAVVLTPAAPPEAAPAVSEPQRPTAWLGVSLSAAVSPDPGDDATGAAPQPPGVRVDGIIDGSPAEEAGLRESDWILSIEDRPVRAPGDLIAAVRSLDPDTWAALEVQRGKTVLRLRVRLSSRAANGSSYRLRKGWIGVKEIDLPPSLRTFFGAPEGAGILVSDVEAGGAAEDAGIEIGDVVFSAGGAPVRSSGDFDRLVTRAGVGNKLEIHLMRYGAEITVEPIVARQPNEKSATR